MLPTQPSRPEDAAASQARREVKRLASEGLCRSEHSSLTKAASSFAAIPTVLNPLLSYMQRTGVSSSVQEGADDHTAGGYL